jgi:hypothetical protein
MSWLLMLLKMSNKMCISRGQESSTTWDNDILIIQALLDIPSATSSTSVAFPNNNQLHHEGLSVYQSYLLDEPMRCMIAINFLAAVNRELTRVRRPILLSNFTRLEVLA